MAEEAVAKLFATEVCDRVVDEATRIYGSYGWSIAGPCGSRQPTELVLADLDRMIFRPHQGER